MSEKDLASMQEAKSSVAPQSITSNTTVNGSAVDRKGYFAATAMIEVGSYTDGDYEIVLQHDDDDGSGSPAGSWEDVPDGDLIGSEPTLSAAGTAIFGYSGIKRHLRLAVTSTSVSSGANVWAALVLGVVTKTRLPF